VSLVVIGMVGCGSEAAKGPFGAPHSSATLAPLAGKWVFDLEKTLAAQKAAGKINDQEVTEIRQHFAGKKGFDALHQDLIFQGNLAMGAAPPEAEGVICEYRFFRMHRHGSTLCGRAWHHEDRFDPGDMSKCYVRLETAGDELRLEVAMQEEPPGLDDPDLLTEPPAEGNAGQCDVESKSKNVPDEWAIYVFRRGQ
jgi:hypothetical protein